MRTGKSKIALALTALVLTLLCGCSAAGRGEKLPLAQEGATEFKIVCGTLDAQEMQTAVEDLQREISRLTGATPAIEDDGVESEYEILIGYTDRAASKSVYETLETMGDFCVCVTGKKLVVVASLEEGLTEATQMLCDALGAYQGEEENSLVLPGDFSIKGTLEKENLMNALPAFCEGKAIGSTESGQDSCLAVYDAPSEGCDAYCTRLEKAGFTCSASAEIDGNRYFTYAGNETTVTVMDNPELGTVRVAAEPEGYLPEAEAEVEAYTSVVQPSVTMLGLEGYSVADGTNQNGMSFLYQLGDGSFIVVDGGHNTKVAVDQLYDQMRAMAPDPNKIVIAAWMISHSHNDHAGAFRAFQESHGSSVSVEKVIAHFPSDEAYKQSDTSTKYREEVINSAARYHAELILAHPGQVFYLRDAKVEILYTVELLAPGRLTTFNDSSVVFTVTLGGEKMIQLGDCEEATGAILTTIYASALQSDMVQVAHHGYGGSAALYEEIDPTYVFWPAGSKTYEAQRGTQTNAWLLNSPRVRWIKPALAERYTAMLPITDQ